MSDIMHRLRQMADAFESEHAPPNLVLHLRAAADEIERLTARVAKLEGALEEAARVADDYRHLIAKDDDHCGSVIAAAIRGMKSSPSSGS